MKDILASKQIKVRLRAQVLTKAKLRLAWACFSMPKSLIRRRIEVMNKSLRVRAATKLVSEYNHSLYKGLASYPPGRDRAM